MLLAGPLMFMGAFILWPITNQVGMEAVIALNDRGLLMLAVVGVLGMSLTFAGLHLLSMDMKKGANRCSTQLLNMADLFIFGTFGLFLVGTRGAGCSHIDHDRHERGIHEQFDARICGCNRIQRRQWDMVADPGCMGHGDDQHGPRTCRNEEAGGDD